ncbi:MAG TPA: cysteine desulfurase family protein [Candidatus Polarisedimenticolaceae bacterium]|nr:cysteine desulfurase family protein [Candidatus Polarisedimenticolaceae bacterium]
MPQPIYLDYNASTPLAPEVLDAMTAVFRDVHGNALSTHAFGAAARDVVERARSEVAATIGASADEIVFTSGGTESNNAAVYGVAEALASRGRHIVITAIEHASIEQCCQVLERRGWAVSRVPVDPQGQIDPRSVEVAIRPDTVLVSVMHANNETGVIQPVAAAARAAHAAGIPVHTDAAQSMGKIKVDVAELDADLLTIAGHKLYAPQGVGALYLKRGTPFEPLVRGAGHQANRRSGTENVALSAALGTACALAGRELELRRSHLQAMRDRLETRLRSALPSLVVHGGGAPRLPNTLYAAFPGCDAQELLSRLDGVATGSGAACHSGKTTPSKVLLAMGVRPEIATATLRLTTGRGTTEAEIDAVAERLVAAVKALIAESTT